jgi:hypothetical protein
MNQEIDEYHGHGGAYVVDAPGQPMRQIEEPTKDHPEGNGPRDADGMLLVAGVRKDDFEEALDSFHKKHGRAAEHRELPQVHAEAKRLGRERAKQRAAARTVSQDTGAAESAKPTDKKAKG